MKTNLSEKKLPLERLVNSVITPLGFQLVQVIFKGGKDRLLKVLIDRVDMKKVSVSDCKEVSESISAALAVEGIIEGSYSIEVSSAGIERPLIKLRDFQMFLGQEIKLKLKKVHNGKIQFKGTLINVRENEIVIDKKGVKLTFDYHSIKQANRIFTDELLRQLLRTGN